jgi:hypothetical protein
MGCAPEGLGAFRQDRLMGLPQVLAAADAVAAIYLIAYGLRRERRDKARVLIVGGMLVVCAVALVVIGWPRSAEPQPTPAPPAPSGPATSV